MITYRLSGYDAELNWTNLGIWEDLDNTLHSVAVDVIENHPTIWKIKVERAIPGQPIDVVRTYTVQTIPNWLD